MPWRVLVIAVVIATGGALGSAAAAGASPRASAAGPSPKSERCETGSLMCVELADPASAFGDKYVGHDEPSVLYYSKHPGSGNRDKWSVTLPKDPPPAVVPGRSWSFQLTPAFWFGVALCDTQSYPQQVSTCKPDSDSNITPLAKHPGTAFMELQFYPPGWVKQFNSQSCDARLWCAALNIDSLSQDPVNGTTINPTCAGHILGGPEYVNFAFLTKSGKPIGPPNPLQFNPATSGNPTRSAGVMFMRPGDHISVTMHDTANGLTTILRDHTTGVTGSMTASAANGFGQIKAAPTGTSCTEIPYNFHPMYSTSSPQTRVPWAAHSYNIAFDEEIGHFDYCNKVNAATFSCAGQEGAPGDQEPTDGDDTACFPASASLLVQVSGCNNTNAPGFDGSSYQADWPDGNTFLHPTAQLFSSPLTGRNYRTNYGQVALETDTARIEASDLGGSCNQLTGAGCTLVPPTDDGHPASFYPFFSITSRHREGGCRWFIGNVVPGQTANDFGGVSQYGTLLPLQYLRPGAHGATVTLFNDYQQAFPANPCLARTHRR